MPQASSKTYCCVSTRSLCFCAIAFLIVYGVGLAAIYWLHAEKYQLTVLFVALGVSCVATFVRNRTFHCVITGPFFLLIALVLALDARGIWKVPTGALWTIVVIVVCAALLIEQKFTSE